MIALKKNLAYISLIILLLLCEIVAYIEEQELYNSFWVNFIRILSWITLGVWYFQEEKKRFNRIQKIFLISNLLSILTTLSFYFFTLNEGLSLSYCINIFIFILWLYVFRLMGARIVFKKEDDFLKKSVPGFFILPIAYFFLTLYPILTPSYIILNLIFILTISYACLLSIFLPINSDKKLWITLGIILFISNSLLFSNYLFIEKNVLNFVIYRIVTVVSRCMMIYGMINYKTSALNEED